MKPIIDPWVDMALFEIERDAQALETLLRQQGFEARTHNDRTAQLLCFFAPPRAVYHVQVSATDAISARERLDTEPTAALVVQRALHCPSCHSVRVQYPQMTRRFSTPSLLLDLGVILRIIDHEAYCENCHYMWPLRKPRSSAAVKRPALENKS